MYLGTIFISIYPHRQQRRCRRFCIDQPWCFHQNDFQLNFSLTLRLAGASGLPGIPLIHPGEDYQRIPAGLDPDADHWRGLLVDRRVS